MDYMCTGALEAIKGFWSPSNRITGSWGLPFFDTGDPTCVLHKNSKHFQLWAISPGLIVYSYDFP